MQGSIISSGQGVRMTQSIPKIINPVSLGFLSHLFRLILCRLWASALKKDLGVTLLVFVGRSSELCAQSLPNPPWAFGNATPEDSRQEFEKNRAVPTWFYMPSQMPAPIGLFGLGRTACAVRLAWGPFDCRSSRQSFGRCRNAPRLCAPLVALLRTRDRT